MALFLDHVAIAVCDLDGAKRFFGLLGFEVADAVVIQGEQFSRYMGVPDLEADQVMMAVPGRGAAPAGPSAALSPSGAAR
jgi:catechol 2,3-dioxygenase-like lactoylglutathione lyase family enzyme